MQGKRTRALLATGLVVGMLGAFTASSSAAPRSDDWPQLGGSAARAGVNPVEGAFTRQSVTSMHLRFTGDIGGDATGSSPVVANGIAYVGSANGELDAFNAAGCLDPFGECEPLWQGHTRNGIYGAPAVDGGVVFVASADRFLYAFAAHGCGSAHCAPLWRGWLGTASLASVAISDGTVFVVSYGGKLLAFAESGCAKSTCHPSWIGLGAGHSTSAPAVGDGFVYYGTYRGLQGHVYAYAAGGCGASKCAPAWQASAGGAGFGAPTVARGNLYVAAGKVDGGGLIDVFAAAGCGAAQCSPTWRAVLGDDVGTAPPAVSGTTLYVAAQGSLDPNRLGVIEAFPADGCGARSCSPTWTGGNLASGTESAPVITGGVVLVAKAPASGVPVDAGVYAFRTSGCGAPTCDPISFFQVGVAQDYFGSSIAVAEGLAFFASYDNIRSRSTLYALEP